MGASEHEPDAGGRSTRPAARARLAVAAACLTAAVAYLTVSQLSGGSGHTTTACPSLGAPEVVRLTAKALSPLRGRVATVLPERFGRLYEEGTVTGASAFSDAEPAPPPLSSTARRPGGYEMRWWAPNHDDIAADVFVFESTRKAQSFLARAVDVRCRDSGEQAGASRPLQARNLAWINPDGYAQADVFFARGRRVYRVTDVPAGAKPKSLSLGQLRRPLFTIDTLSCLLPDAHCQRVRQPVPV